MPGLPLHQSYRGMTRFVALGDVHDEWMRASSILGQFEADDYDFCLQVGDAQPCRTEEDLTGLSVPNKYRKMGDFPRVLTGEITFSRPLFFIGGNHEPWLFLDEHGPGPICNRIEYLGRAGVRDIGGLTVGFLSGNYSPTISHNINASRLSVRHRTYFTQADIDVLLAADKQIDVMMTHIWPRGLDWDGTDIGCPLFDQLLALRPRLWICGHMHRSQLAKVNQGDTQVVALGAVPHWQPGAAALIEMTTDTARVLKLSL